MGEAFFIYLNFDCLSVLH